MPSAADSPPGADSAARYVFLDYLRALAAWLVVWDHLGTILPGWVHLVFVPAQWVRDHVTGPLGIIQDFGWFGVAVFFLISGFIISDRASVESFREFAVKRLLRIYPMFIFAVLFAAAFVDARDQVNAKSLLLNLTLANYFFVPLTALVGVAWTLFIEMIFYGLTAVTQFARNSPHRIAINLIFTALVVWKRGVLGGIFTPFAAFVAYMPVLVMGQTIYWWLARSRLSAAWGLAYLTAAFAVFLWGVRLIQPSYLPATNSYLISVAYAVLLFLAVMRLRLPQRRAIRFLADTSYSVYLLHGLVGSLVLFAVLKHAPLGVAIALAAIASLLAAAVTQRFIETPANRLARRLTARWRLPGPAAPAAAS
ncbi:acyltransferase [Phenylobacterium sp.]|uniref:acyltransferase family protein n=1 Tax=Phenylobacterium sp. TaxID=1871053 RepID=UPI002C585C0B|nr:acyltransferase [Phenylobacterium sp.]HLZ75436.1 acyltransferase [Phenylobacterium sp.]